MCGRYIQVSSPTLLTEHFGVDEIAIPETPEADYNVAPRNEVLTIVHYSREKRQRGSALRRNVLRRTETNYRCG